MSETPTNHDITELIEAYMDGSLRPQEAQELLRAIQSNTDITKILMQELRDSILIQEVVCATEQAATLEALTASCVKETSSSETKDRISANAEKRAEEIQQYAEKQLRTFLEEQKRLQAQQVTKADKQEPYLHVDIKKIGHNIDRFLTSTYKTLIWSAAAASIILTLIIGYQRIFPNKIVARLVDQNHAKWHQPIDSNNLPMGWYQLNRGFAQLHFNKGAEVVIQAPCRFELLSSTRMYVESGSLSIELADSSDGFTVNTPTLEVTDLGTEFGIHVGGTQHSEIHVFDGKVEIGDNQGSSKIPLSAGRAAWTNTQGQLDVGQISDRPSLFIRKIKNTYWKGTPGVRIDLADIVGGGNGYGTGIHMRSSSSDPQGTINTLTGNRNDPWRPDERFKRESKHYLASMAYHPNDDSPFIDGTFMPDGGQGTCVISTAGHVFQDCPDTDGQVFVNIMNGWLYASEPHTQYNNQELSTTPGLFMHANAGITFDLNNIRASLSGTQIRSFSTQAWMPSLGREDFTAEIWILLDGQVQLHEQLVMSDEKLDIAIPIPPETQFLTLVTTDAQDNVGTHPSNNDQCHFLKPYLILDDTKGYSPPERDK